MSDVVAGDAQSLPQAYAAWRLRTLAGSLLASAVGLYVQGPTGEFRADFEGEWPSIWLLLGLAAILIGAVGPPLAGSGLALAAIWKWRRLRTSSRLTRAAWVMWVLGPMPLLLVPISHLMGLNLTDSLRTSAHQVRHLITVTAPAFLALLPGTLRAALIVERFLPESRAPGQIALLAAPACAVAYLIPLGVVAQLAYQPWLYLGLLLLASSPVVPLLAVHWLLQRNAPGQSAQLVRVIVVVQVAVSALGLVLVARWIGDHPLLQELLGHVKPIWVVGLAAKMLASQWLTTVVVTDLVVSLLHQGREAARSLTDTAEGDTLAHKLDALGTALRPARDAPA
ncbi:MAG: hypothetical protein JNM56_12110 [Planctomycetia bacterium]|nr:hypothetical protein [Planctomycetia bacterium]